MMKILFVHQNFPGQFKWLAPELARRGHDVRAFCMRAKAPESWEGVRLLPYGASRGSTPGVHPWLTDFETKTIRGEAAFRHALALKAQGYAPDVIVAHPGWGESLFLKDVWPAARLGIYCEFFYRLEGGDVGFDPEFPETDPGEGLRLRLKNLNNLLHFEAADAGLSPTEWQASTFPEPFRSRITIVHDGIDTASLRPNERVSAQIGGSRRLTRDDEVITFVNRNLEPYRGYHIFMRALPEILRRRPRAHVLIVGGDGVSYGAPPPPGASWKAIFADEVRPQMPESAWSRVHFLGAVPYEAFVALLQLSRAHVYLTYPFVLSWSLLEAMSIGCPIVASDTAPVREAILDGETGRLVDFFDVSGLADQVCALLEDRSAAANLSERARAFAQAHYDLRAVCLPRQLRWIDDLAA